MASGDTKTEALLNILGSGGDASGYRGCCNTKSQAYILDAIDRVQTLQDDVGELRNNPDVVDIVDTYADLQAYDTQHLTNNDIIRVLNDSTHDGYSTYYRWDAADSVWAYIGMINGYTVDSTLDAESMNPVQNKVITATINEVKSDIDRRTSTGQYDYTNVDLTGFAVGSNGKWTSSSIAKTHTFRMPKNVREITIKANSSQPAIVAFLNTFTPVTGENVDFAPGFTTRVTVRANTSVTYAVTPGMNYFYTLIRDTSSNDHTPSVTMKTPSDMLLSSDGTQNDRGGEISVLLNAFRRCELDGGNYYITSTVKMHDSSVLKGNGGSLILANSVSEGSTIKMGTNCLVTTLTISGGLSSAPSTAGTRYGVEWTGEELFSSYIDNCIISGFSGAGIYLHDTTAKTYRNLMINSCRITANYVGIDIYKNSEFNKITNCTIVANRYGVRNRGGNNIISNCGVDANTVGIQVDMDEGSNNGHGNIANCTINHSDHNNGYGLIIKDTGRMVVTGCNFYYSKILLDNTDGNVINGCGFGSSASWEISGGECSMFSNCIVRGWGSGNTTVTISDNTASKIVNCYDREGNAYSAP